MDDPSGDTLGVPGRRRPVSDSGARDGRPVPLDAVGDKTPLRGSVAGAGSVATADRVAVGMGRWRTSRCKTRYKLRVLPDAGVAGGVDEAGVVAPSRGRVAVADRATTADRTIAGVIRPSLRHPRGDYRGNRTFPAGF